MATLPEQQAAEARMRDWLHEHDLPQPDAVAYGCTCVRFFFHDTMTCLVLDVDEDPDLAPGEVDDTAPA